MEPNKDNNTSKNSRLCQALLRRQTGRTRPVWPQFWNFESKAGVLNWPYSTHSELTSDLMLWIYSGFISLILFLLALDLGVFHRKAHVISVREALGWSAFWIFLGVSFSIFIYFGYENHWLGLGLTPDMMGSAPKMVEGLGTVYNDGASATMKYLTGYLVEKFPLCGQHLRHQHDLRLLESLYYQNSPLLGSSAHCHAWCDDRCRAAMIQQFS